MKKWFTLLLAILLMLGTFCVTALAAEPSVEVYVTIADEDGRLALAQEKCAVTDVDNDGALTIHDALYAAHAAKYPGGAAAGYAASAGAYGLAIDKLWGAANGSSYGYYVNNTSALSLADPVQAGDYINAYVFTDLTAWSDAYSYFDVYTVQTDAGKAVALTLSYAGFDAAWNPIVVPVDGATITVNGQMTPYKTDKDGKVTLTLPEAGSFVISAVSHTQTLVPPACIATVKPANNTGSNPTMGDHTVPAVLVTILALLGAGVVLYRKKAYEK